MTNTATTSNKRVLHMAIKAGAIMLSSGAEIYRVEDTVTRICNACDIPYVECYATPSGIFLSLGQDETSDVELSGDAAAAAAAADAAAADAAAATAEAAATTATTEEVGTIIKRVRRISTDLEKVSRVNDFIKDFCAGRLTVDEGIVLLRDIEHTEQFALPLRIGALVLVSLCFTLMNRGDFFDGIASILAGATAYILTLGIERLKINRFISIFTSCFTGTMIGMLLFNAGLGASLSAIIIGTITIYLPGVAITNAARDLLSGDMISGVARVAESMLIAVAIAGGVGVMLGLAPDWLRVDTVAQMPIPVLLAAAFLGTLGISIIVNIPRLYMLPACLIAACSWACSYFLVSNSLSPILACFIGACLVALLAEIATHISKKTATIFIIPAIFPLVPGIGLYNTMHNLIIGNLELAAQTGSQALFVAGGIAVGLLVVISLSRLVMVIRGLLTAKTSKG